MKNQCKYIELIKLFQDGISPKKAIEMGYNKFTVTHYWKRYRQLYSVDKTHINAINRMNFKSIGNVRKQYERETIITDESIEKEKIDIYSLNLENVDLRQGLLYDTTIFSRKRNKTSKVATIIKHLINGKTPIEIKRMGFNRKSVNVVYSIYDEIMGILKINKKLKE